MNLEDIAKLAGVSRSTVSRVVNNDPRVSSAVRSRVLRIIAEHNYHPNVAARSLASRRSRVFGLLIPQVMESIFGDPWFPPMIQGCMDGCRAADYSLTLLMESSTDSDAVDRLIERTVHTRHLDGLVISTSIENDILSDRLATEHFPSVVIGRDSDDRFSFVDIDNRGAARMATEHLLSHGYRHLAAIVGLHTLVTAEDRLLGFFDALEGAGLDSAHAPVRYGNYQQRDSFLHALDLLSSESPPEAIFVASDSMAWGVLDAARSLHLRVPEDLAVIGFDDIQQERNQREGLSTIRQPARRLGERAVELLVDLVAQPLRDPIQEWLPVDLVLASSCGCLAPSLPQATIGFTPFRPRESQARISQVGTP
ncbi:MAG: LacI family DNA-binding transcriptional regulator [Thermomicrobiales bacterium]